MTEELPSERPRVPPPVEKEKPLFDLNAIMAARKAKGEPITLTEAYMLRSMMREDRLERMEANKPKEKPVNVEKVVKDAVSTVLEEYEKRHTKSSKEEMPDWAKEIRKQQDELFKRLKEEEMPGWAKEMQKQQGDILQRLTKEDEEKRLRETVEKVTNPLKTELDKAKETIKTLSSKPPAPSKPPKSAIDLYIEGRNKLKEAGILTEPAPGGGVMVKGGEVPLSGSIPAALFYGPEIADKIMEAIEKRIENIGIKYGLIETPGKAEALPKKGEIIKLPKKPAAPPPAPPPAPKEEKPPPPPPTEEKLEVAEVPKLAPAEEKPAPPAPPLIRLPEKPEAAPPPAPPVEEKAKPEAPEVPLCSRCGTPVTEIPTKRGGKRYRCPNCNRFVKIKEKKTVEQKEKPRKPKRHTKRE